MKFLTIPTAFLLAIPALAQNAPSDSLFNTDQVVAVELTFADPGFWTLLTTYYANDLGQTLTGDVTITDNTGTHFYPSVAVDLKGNSSYGHPGNKKSFKIDFNDNIPGQKYHGMTKLHFNNCFKDPTFMRERIFFDFCRDHGVLAPRVSYANVSMNGTFWGFYDLVEAVDKNFLDRWLDDNDGNLFKAGDNFGTGSGGAADLAYYGVDQNGYTARYELKTNETENDWSDLIALLELLNTASDADLIAQLPAQWEWAPLLRSLAIDNLFSNLDSYINSARNYYIYHDSTTFRWNWIKWDANEAFGSYSGGPGTGTLTNLATNYAAASRPLLARIFAQPVLYGEYLEQYCTAFEAFSNAELDTRIDAIKTLIAPHVAADPNKMYTTAQFNTNVESNITSGGGPGGGTIYGLKSFINARRTYLNGVLDCATVGFEETFSVGRIAVHPVPATTNIDIRIPTGTELGHVRVMDALGRAETVQLTGSSLDITGLPPGVHVLSVTLDGLPTTLRFIKE